MIYFAILIITSIITSICAQKPSYVPSISAKPTIIKYTLSKDDRLSSTASTKTSVTVKDARPSSTSSTKPSVIVKDARPSSTSSTKPSVIVKDARPSSTASNIVLPSAYPTPKNIIKKLNSLPTSRKVNVKNKEPDIIVNQPKTKKITIYAIISIILLILILYISIKIIINYLTWKPKDKKNQILPLHTPTNSPSKPNSPNHEKYYGFQTPSPGLYRRANSYSSFTE